MENEMIERVARRLAAMQDSFPHGFDGGPEDWTPYARAALEEMREPTAAMIETDYAQKQHPFPGTIWTAMIDAALA